MRRSRPRGTVMFGVALPLSLWLAACAQSPMVTATSSFAAVTRTSVEELGAGPRMVMDLCWQNAEINYVFGAITTAEDNRTFHEWLDRPLPGPTAGAPATSWRKICAQYRLADDGFEHGLDAIAAYGKALGAVAAQMDQKVELQDLASSVAADAAGLSGKAEPYKGAISGVGKPLGDLATALVGHWEQGKLRELVAQTDAPFHEVLRQLLAFLNVVRREQMPDVRKQLAEVTQAVGAPTLNKFTAAYMEVEITRRLDRIDRKLATLVNLLSKLGQAHTMLKDGWQRDEAGAVDTIKAIAIVAKDVYGSVRAFQNPQTGESQ